MDQGLKKNIKKVAKDTEIKVAESILRWKYKKEGKALPDEPNLGQQSRLITEQANEIISKRGKLVWKEIKKSYRKMRNGGGSED